MADQGIARVGDTFVGQCMLCDGNPVVSGMLITGAVSVEANSLGIVRVGDIGIGTCGHITMVLSGEDSVFAEGNNVAKIGSVVASDIQGSIVQGSVDVLA